MSSRRGYVEPPPQMIQGGMPPTEVLAAVRASGLRPLTQPARRGGQYVLLASDNMGGQLRVAVSAYNGRILHAEPAHDPRFAYGPARPRGSCRWGLRSMRQCRRLHTTQRRPLI